MRLPHPFIQLPLKFDDRRLAAEVSEIEERAWRPHPQNYPGNSMLPLIAADGDPANESFGGDMRPTPHLERCAYLKQVMSSLGVVLGRSRLMRLAGQAEVTPHADQGYYWIDRVRIHVPIVTQPAVRFECGDGAVHMAAGECWIFDTWRVHRVLNDDTRQRIHLVVDTVGGPKFWEMADAGRPHPAAREASGWSPQEMPFNADAPAPLLLESTNVPVIMSPWEVAAHLAFLVGDAEQKPELQAVRRLAAGFMRDWRALWAHYGPNPEAHTIYQRRLDMFVAAVQPAASALKLRNGLNLHGAMMAMIGNTAVSAPAAAAKTVAAMADLG
jgi:hypothetical protein